MVVENMLNKILLRKLLAMHFNFDLIYQIDSKHQKNCLINLNRVILDLDIPQLKSVVLLNTQKFLITPQDTPVACPSAKGGVQSQYQQSSSYLDILYLGHLKYFFPILDIPSGFSNILLQDLRMFHYECIDYFYL